MAKNWCSYLQASRWVLQDGKFNALSTAGDPDLNRKIVKLELDFKPAVTDTIDSSVLGGKIGGLLDFPHEYA